MKKLFASLLILLVFVTSICCSSSSPAAPVATKTPASPTASQVTSTDVPVMAAERSVDYIVLTPNSEDYDKFYIYIDKIMCVESYSPKSKWFPGCAVLTPGATFSVKETAEEVLKMIEDLR